MQSRIAADLARLGVRRMLLAIHDASFPADPDEDLGRGSPSTRAAERLFAYAHGLGFSGIQLGPHGQTSRDNPSPYDSTLFSRHLGNLSAHALRTNGALGGLVDEAAIERLLAPGGTVRHHHAYDAIHELVDLAYVAIERGARPDLATKLAAFSAANRQWLERDALYAVLHAAHGGRGVRDWSVEDQTLWQPGGDERRAQLLARHARAITRYAFGQLLVHEDHLRVREAAARHRLLLYADLQVGTSDGDAWAYASCYLRDYRMGAPPSRTNPEGQPWGYAVLDPDQFDGAARDLVIARLDKAFAEYDSLRIDHPHGLVCPWVYRAGTDDDLRAVQGGARLFDSPDLPDHPALAHYAIARPEQLDRALPRHADGWVARLDPVQIDQYAILFDVLVACAERHGRSKADLSAEVLSTLPYPLACMLARHGLGRWRVLQKANLDDPTDVYRSENAQPADWVMLGNHDTAPIFALVHEWSAQKREQWARHLAERLRLARPERLADPGFLATAMLAELFASRAENVSIFFADLFGCEERYNRPGEIAADNWTLRLPHDFERLHAERLARRAALDIPLAIELALAARS